MTSDTTVALPPSPPKFVIAILNTIISFLLRSPLHGTLSKSTIVLSFKGVRSRKIYTFPVGYYDLRENTLFVIPLHGWWKNLRGNVPVTFWLKGCKYQGFANATHGDDKTVQELERLIAEAPNLIRLYKIPLHDQAQLDAERLRQVAQALPLIHIHFI